MKSARLLFVTATLLLAGPVFAWPASAFWSGAASGTTSESVGALRPPTGVVATAPAGASTVRVAWTRPTAPTGRAMDGFYVQRLDGTTPSPACATSPTSLTTGATCDDPGLAEGTYTYTVTAVFRSWTAESQASGPVSVTKLDHLTVSVASGARAGAPMSLTVTARDASGATVAGYLGTVHFTSTDPQATVPADYTFVAGDAGTRTFTGGLTFRTSGSQALTAADTVRAATSATATVVVDPGMPTTLAFAQQPASTTAGATITPSVTVRITDTFGNLTTSTATVGLAVTGGTATLSGTATRPGVAGVASFADLSLTTAGIYTLTATSTGLSSTTSTSFTSRAGAAAKLCIGPPQPTCIGALTVAVERGSTMTGQLSIVDHHGNAATATSAISVTLTGEGQIEPLAPATVTIGTGSSVSGTLSVTIKAGSNKTGTVTATATGFNPVSVTLRSS